LAVIRLFAMPKNQKKPPSERARRSNRPPNSVLFRQLVESAKDYAIFTTDMKGKITSWNSGAQRLLNFSSDDAIGMHADSLFIPEDRARNEPQKELDLAKDQGHAANERWHIKRDGGRFWGSGVVTPLLNRKGQQIGFLKIMRDLTERKRMENRLSQKTDELEQFCHVVAHDLQAPIRKMANFAELIKAKSGNKLDPTVKNYVDRIIQSAMRLTTLVQDLLRFAKTVDPVGAF
jgi:PAS domain S-box-containing protein